MATSSINHNFVIRGAAVEAFVKAIDESEAVKDSIPLEPAPCGAHELVQMLRML